MLANASPAGRRTPSPGSLPRQPHCASGSSPARPPSGTFIFSASPFLVEVVARAGLDWLLIDLEHGTADESDLAAPPPGRRAAGTSRRSCASRAGERIRVGRALDLGAGGIMVPQVHSAEQARRVAGWMRTQPEGERGIALFTRGMDFGRVGHDGVAGRHDEPPRHRPDRVARGPRRGRGHRRGRGRRRPLRRTHRTSRTPSACPAASTTRVFDAAVRRVGRCRASGRQGRRRPRLESGRCGTLRRRWASRSSASRPRRASSTEPCARASTRPVRPPARPSHQRSYEPPSCSSTGRRARSAARITLLDRPGPLPARRRRWPRTTADAGNLLWKWQLLEYRGADGSSQLVPPGIGITALPFAGDRQGRGRLQQLSRPATASSGRASASTRRPSRRRGCDPAAQAIDDAFYQGLADTRTWSTSGSILTLMDEVGDVGHDPDSRRAAGRPDPGPLGAGAHRHGRRRHRAGHRRRAAVGRVPARRSGRGQHRLRLVRGLLRHERQHDEHQRRRLATHRLHVGGRASRPSLILDTFARRHRLRRPARRPRPRGRRRDDAHGARAGHRPGRPDVDADERARRRRRGDGTPSAAA